MLDVGTFAPAAMGTYAVGGTKKLAVLMYTSGSSGLAKGVRLTQGNLKTDVDAAIAAAGFEHGHKFLGVVPLFHAFGMTAMMLVPMQLGSAVVYIGRFSPVACLNAIREHGVSLMFGVPSMYQPICRPKDITRDDLAGVYGMFIGGEPLWTAVRELFESRFRVTLYQGYGLIWTSPILAQNVPGASRASSGGRPLPNVVVRIAAEDGPTPRPARRQRRDPSSRAHGLRRLPQPPRRHSRRIHPRPLSPHRRPQPPRRRRLSADHPTA